MKTGWSVQWVKNGRKETFETVSREEADAKVAEVVAKGGRNVTVYQCIL